jgi:hypothetical protein
MIAEIAKFVLEFLKLAPRYFIALGLFAAFLIFCPDGLLRQLGVFDFAQSNRTWLGVALIASAALFAVSVSVNIFDWLKAWWRRRKEFRHITKRLCRLTEDEKQILRFYISEKTRTNTLSIEDGVVQELVSERIIYRSASVGSMLEGFAHNISDIAWDYLDDYPQLLEGSTNTYRTDKRRGMW